MRAIIFAASFTLLIGFPFWQIKKRLTKPPPTNNEIRQYPEHRIWSSAVKKRDGWCIFCHSIENLEAHHLYSFAGFPELRFDVKNGITLCRKCHKLTPNYGRKQKQFDGRIKSQSLL